MVKFKKSLLAIICSAGLILSTHSYANVLHDAVNSNDYQQVERIISSNPSLLSGFDDDGNTPLHVAIKNENSAALESFMKYKKTINPQVANKQGDTPLVYSIKNKKYQALVTMLQNGFNPFYKDQNQKDSFDYVNQYGDDTIKDIYKSYYNQNKARIDQVNESKKNTATPQVEEVKTTVQKELTASKTNSGKPQTVADLLMGNIKNKKTSVSEPVATVVAVESPKNLVEVPKKPEEATLTADQLNDIYKRIDTLKIDQASLETLKEQVETLKKENQYLKNQLNFRQDLGRDQLTEQERIMANSKYAPIYQQQMLYDSTDEQGSSDLPFMEPGKDMIVISDKDSSDNINTAIPAITNNINNVTVSPTKEVKEDIKTPSMEPINDVKEEIKKDDILKKEIPIVVTSEIPVVGQSPIVNKSDDRTESTRDDSVSVKQENHNEKNVNREIVKNEVISNEEEVVENKSSNKLAVFILTLCLVVGISCIVGYIYITIKENKEKKISNVKKDKE